MCQLSSSLMSLNVRSLENCSPGSQGVSLGAASFTCTSSYLSLIKALSRRTTCPLWTGAWPPNKSMLFGCVDVRRRKQMWRNEVEVATLVPGCRSASLKLQPTLSRTHKLFGGFKSKFQPWDHVQSFSISTVNGHMLCQVFRHICFLHFHQVHTQRNSISLFHWKAKADSIFI